MKFIIHYKDDIPPQVALQCVKEVIADGRISKARGREQYCFVSTFKLMQVKGSVSIPIGEKIIVYAMERRNDTTDTFKVWKEKG